MIQKSSIRLDKRYIKTLKGRVNGYDFDIGIIKDTSHKSAKSKNVGHKRLAGGPARKATTKKQKTTLAEVSKYLRNRFRINLFTKPFKIKTNREIIRFANTFLKSVMSNGVMRDKKRIENLLQAIVRNPIARGDYGSNSPASQRVKGFNRLFIDTGQLFNGIRARINKRTP